MEETAREKPEDGRETAGAEEAGAASGERAEESPTGDIPLPPATFGFLVLSLRSQAEMHLGLLHFGGEEEQPKPSLPLARHAIDMMAMLEEKTKGNLTLEESRLVENSLTELRFRYVQVAEELKKG